MRYPSLGRLASITLLCTGLVTSVVATGCTSKKQEAKERLEKAIQRCRAADGPIHEAPLREGEETKPVLVSACIKEMGDVEVSNGNTAEVSTGPYTWTALYESSSGSWTVTGVTFPELDKALSLLDDDPGKNALDHGIENLREARKAYPESGWIRLRMLEALLNRRVADREYAESGLELGDDVASYFSDTVEWANDNDKTAVAAQARLQIIEFYEDFIDDLNGALSNLGDKDEWRKNAIEQANDEGNEQRAQKLEAQLEELEKKRKEKKKRYPELIDKAEQRSCQHLSKLTPTGVSDKQVREEIKSQKGAIDCRKRLKEGR